MTRVLSVIFVVGMRVLALPYLILLCFCPSDGDKVVK